MEGTHVLPDIGPAAVLSPPTATFRHTHNSNQDTTSQHVLSLVEPRDFLYNARIAMGLIPCLAVITTFIGELALLPGCVGFMFCYLFDLTANRELTFFTVWATVVLVMTMLVVQSVHLISASLVNLFVLFEMGVCMVLVGIWASLQFRWISQFAPHLAVQFERLLFSLLPVCCNTLLTWVAITGAGLAPAPFLCLLIAALSCALYAVPLRSSFDPSRPAVASEPKRRAGGRDEDGGAPDKALVADPDALVSGRVSTAVAVLLVVVLPLGLYSSIHRHTYGTAFHQLRSHEFAPGLSFHLGLWAHLDNILLLACGSLLVLRALANHGVFWFARMKPRTLNVPAALALVVGLVVLVQRVTPLLRTMPLFAVSPPWDWLGLLTSALSCGAVACLTVPQLNVVPWVPRHPTLQVLAAVCAASACALVAMPLLVQAVVVLSAVALAQFYNNSSKHYYYFAFATGCTLAVAWFASHTFGFLVYRFRARLFDLFVTNLQHAALLLVVLFALCAALPGLAAANSGAFPIVLLSYVLGLCGFERVLTREWGGLLYPGYFVMMTSGVLLFALWRLRKEKRVDVYTVWMCGALAVAKASALLHRSGSVMASLALVLAVSAPLVFQPRSGSVAQLCMVVLLAAFSFFAQYSVFVPLLVSLVEARAPEGCALGLCFMTFGLGLLPLAVPKVFSQFMTAPEERTRASRLRAGSTAAALGEGPEKALLRIVLTASMAIGALIVYLHPESDSPIELVRAALFAISPGIALDPTDTFAAMWTAVGLACAGAGVLLAVTVVSPSFAESPIRLQLVEFAGFLIGAGFAPFFFAVKEWPLLILAASWGGVFACAAGLLARLGGGLLEVHPNQPEGRPSLMICIWAIGMMLTIIGIKQNHPLKVPSDMRQSAQAAVLGHSAMFAAVNLVVAFCFKLHCHAADQQKVSHTSAAAPRTSRTTDTHCACQTVCNAATLAGFFFAALCSLHLGCSETSVFLLSPVLLMLTPCSVGPFTLLTDSNRYFPIVFVNAAFLTLTVLFNLGVAVLSRNMPVSDVFAFAVNTSTSSALGEMSLVVKNMVLLVAVWPSVGLFCKFLGTLTPQNTYWLLLSMPLALVALIFADLLAVQILGVMGLVGSVVAIKSSWSILDYGLRFI
eukprot:gnl/Spiro4/14353_TR7727_c0_g1_i1.p1 gnl/Spiro4/14353_TR7727_c0_g1~~gnl/Spiro4/14353_TR7727_c0_g1_i1.p1  ORF type:complete len:1154 (+),score=419.57 gnl/Spiro4/14353_TR7727_c0_g1_i1:64-3462(+)